MPPLPVNIHAADNSVLRAQFLPSMLDRLHFQEDVRECRKKSDGHDPYLSELPLHNLAVLYRLLSTLASLKENVILSALVARFAPKDRQKSSPVVLVPQCEVQFHILIECVSHNNTLLPHCYTQIVFATAFIDAIIEQQSQSSLVVLRWPGAEENTGIAGKLLRPETYHYMMNAGRF